MVALQDRAAAAVLLCVAVVCSAAPAAVDPMQDLVQIHVLMRHGQRAPIHVFPGDTTENSTYWPRGYGHLLKEGLQQQSALGQWLRQRYSTLLQVFPHYDMFYVLSSDVDRCLNSATANLAAFFSTPENEQYRAGFNFTPVPVHTVPVDLDLLMDVGEACKPLYGYISEDISHSPEAVAFLNSHQDMIKELEQYLKVKISSMSRLAEIADTFKVHLENKIPLPEVIKKYYKPLHEVGAWEFQNIAPTDRIKTLRGGGGRLLKRIIDDIKNYRSKQDKRRMFMYSAHDDTVAVNLNTLGAFNGLPPPYASAVIYEVYNHTGVFDVKVLYQNETMSNFQRGPWPVEVPACGGSCTVETLEAAVGKYFPGPNTYSCDE